MTVSGNHPWSLSQLHLLLTGECNFECDHCFVWSGPGQGNTMSRDTIGCILDQAEELGTIEWIYFEGGEPFLFYELLLWGVQQAHQRGFRVGMVSNAYWAEDIEKAIEKLRPMAGLVEDLSISHDAYHGSGGAVDSTVVARRAANELSIPVDFISVDGPGSDDGNVRYRGRAAAKLAPHARHHRWDRFTSCLWEDLRRPSRVHVDSLGNLHICQGLSIGNLLEHSLAQIMSGYDPETHPVIGPLLKGGPAALARQFSLDFEQDFADACHLCYLSRDKLRDLFPDILPPGQMYGMPGSSRRKTH